jgi:D-alanyl-lipoteichoic acid acyltransferase DltB (MBOAT superfamily)
MLFNSLEFAVFFPIVTLLYFVLPQRLRVPLLLAASCVFYMAFIPKYILILVFVILVDYSMGLLIESAEGPRRKLLLVVSLCANISILAFFKYYNFLNENVAALFESLGWSYAIPSLNIILPIGLSFHTFQSMSYTIEVYRRRQAAERSLPIFALYVLFYPQLVAGPIERPQNLLHQFREHHRFDFANLVQGAQLIATGLFKKIVIADRAAIVVNAVYANPGAHSGSQLLIATLLFAVQIYADFAGYTEIARGAAKVMGFDMMVNFNSPYLATSIADFWRRWHISLSTWFRDYVYVPLGGNRVSEGRACFNLAVVFLVSGLWHGANWTFVIWGALHAFYMVIYVLTGRWRRQVAERAQGVWGFAWTAAGWLVTVTTVCFAWIFFRAASLSDAMLIIRRIASSANFGNITSLHPGIDALQFGLMLGAIASLFVLEGVSRRGRPVWSMLAAQPRAVRLAAYYLFFTAFATLLFLNPVGTAQPFVYFQF